MPISPSDTHDLAVIGAGPAGLAAAVTAADLGLTVALVDAAARPGGQFYRQPAPGLGAAGAQAMLKAGLVLPGQRIVVAGSGPLLLAVAGSLAAAGARVPVVVEAGGYAGYARAPRTLAANPRKLVEGAAHAATLRGVWAAGEVGGVGGAELALVEGVLAAHDIAGRVLGGALLRRRDRLRRFAGAMAAAHAPRAGWSDWLGADTEVCGCEEVTAGRIRKAVDDLGARDTRTVKLLTRAGMGWCQGRVCGPAVAHLAGEAEPAAGRRLLACPVTLGALARE